MKPILLFLSLLSFVAMPSLALADHHGGNKSDYSKEDGEQKMHRKGKYGKGKHGKKWTNPDGSEMTQEQKQARKESRRERRQERKRQKADDSTQG